MSLSVSESLSRAFERTRKLLFQPFDLTKWLTLGLVAFLAHLGEGGGSLPSLGGSDSRRGFRQLVEFIEDNLTPIIAVGVVVLLIALALGILITWVSSRGKFMFLDAVVHDRAAVVEPWQRFASAGNNLFWFRFWLALLGLITVGGPILAGVFLAWGDIRAEAFGERAATGLLVAMLAILPAFALAVIALLLEDFVVPAMYLRQLAVGPAWQTARQEIFAGNVGSLVVFYLMKMLVGLLAGMVAAVLTCVTCCVASLPYLSSVALLPFSVFLRCFSVHFIEGLGPAWQVFPPDPSDEPWRAAPHYGFAEPPRGP